MDTPIKSEKAIIKKEKYLSPQALTLKGLNQTQLANNGKNEEAISGKKSSKRKSNKFINKFITNVGTTDNNSKKTPKKRFHVNRFEKYVEKYKEKSIERVEQLRINNMDRLKSNNSMRIPSKNRSKKNEENSNSVVLNNKKALKFYSKKSKKTSKNKVPMHSHEKILKNKSPIFLESFSFNPTVNTKSVILDKKLNKNNNMQYTRWEKLYFLSEKQRELKKEEKKEEEEVLDPECTFAPKLNSKGNYRIEKSMNERAEKWIKYREEKLKNLSEEILKSGKGDFTFIPNLSKEEIDDFTPNKISQDSINKFLEKKRIFNEEKLNFQIMNDNKIGSGKNWKNAKTILKPFNLSKAKKEKELRQEAQSTSLKKLNKSFKESSSSELVDEQEKLNKTQIVISENLLSTNLNNI